MVQPHGQKILLLKVERPEDEREFASPMGIMYVADAVRKAGFDVEILHETWTARLRQRLMDKIRIEQSSILLVGFSTITGPSLGPTIAAAKAIKRAFPSIPIVWGGVHASLLPEETLRNDFVDIVVVGEGERTLVELARCIRNGTSLGEVDGIAFRDKGVHITKARRFIENLDMYEPAWDLVSLDKYYRPLGRTGRRALDIVTSRGCPHGCTFCYNTSFNRRKWRAHSVEFVVSQVRMLRQRYGVDSIKFQDDNFFTHKARAFAVLEAIEVPWYAEIRADYFCEEDIDRMKILRCENLFIGAESGSDRVLGEIAKKGIRTKHVVTAVRLCRDKINLTLSFIIGFPGESRAELFQTLDFIADLRDLCKSNMIMLNTLVLVPGTEIYDRFPEEDKPRATWEWASLTRQAARKPWVRRQEIAMFRSILFAHQYLSDSEAIGSRFEKRILALEKFRWRYKFFFLPIEIRLEELKRRFNVWRPSRDRVRRSTLVE